MSMILVDGSPEAVIPADDRGFGYGDGVFRTLALRDGLPQCWEPQYAKLAADCRALGIGPPAAADLLADIRRIAAQLPDCALRITVTRGTGGRGYVPPAHPQTRRVVSAAPLPAYPSTWPEQGVTVRWCELRLATQPRLAGIKHLNRLENVLARAEWHDPAVAEGLLLDASDQVIGGTRCNLFVVEAGALITPDLSRCGVAGVTRELVMAAAVHHGLRCRIETISRARLAAADAVLLVNSLIGVWPVAALGERRWTDFRMAALVRKWLDALRFPHH